MSRSCCCYPGFVNKRCDRAVVVKVRGRTFAVHPEDVATVLGAFTKYPKYYAFLRMFLWDQTEQGHSWWHRRELFRSNAPPPANPDGHRVAMQETMDALCEIAAACEDARSPALSHSLHSVLDALRRHVRDLTPTRVPLDSEVFDLSIFTLPL